MAQTKIMVVEDEGLVGLLLQEKLRAFGYDVAAVVARGEEAISAAHTTQPELILMDVHLAGDFDGVTTATRIHEDLDIPVVYLTAYSDQATVDRAKVTTPFGYLIKPFQDRELQTTIEVALYKHGVEKQLREREQWLATTLRSIGDAVVTTDVQGDVTFMNPAAETLTGWSCPEAIGQEVGGVFRLIDEHTRTTVDNPVLQALQQGHSLDLPPGSLLVTRQGTERPVGDNVSPIHDARGNMLGAVLVFRDMTVYRQIEQERLKAQKIESLGIMAGGIAHDFNNVLTGILGNISLAKFRLPAEDKMYQYLAHAEQGVEQATNLTKRLITFAKGGAPVKQVVPTEPVLRDTVSFALQGSNVRGEFCTPAALWALDADAGQIVQVISNLAINARQAMPAGGIVKVATENREIGADSALPLSAGPYVQITIQDQGSGIAPDLLSKIFDPYFTTKSTGTGLGLAVTYAIVKHHGGHITVTSTMGQGTAFVVYLPATFQQSPAPHTGEQLIMGQGRLLLMDDDPTIRDVAEAMLRYLGYEVETCTEGVATLERYRHAMATGVPFDAVILDLTIPGGMGGQETLQQLRALDPGVKAIVSSGYSDDPAAMAQCQTMGFRGIIPKPYDLEEASRTIHQVLQEKLQGPASGRRL